MSNKQMREALVLQEVVRADVYRARPDGSGWYDEPEALDVYDLIVTTGRNYIARRIVGNDSQTAPGSAMAYMAVGTVSTAPALGDTTLTGEIKRKALSLSSAGITAGNVYTAVTTFGGSADSITSLSMVEAGLFNHASSGQGTMMQRVTFAAVILANSDLLKITLETNVGSS